MKKLFFITFWFLTTLFTACKKTDLIGPKVVSTAPLSESYQPTTAGSVWKYVNKVTGLPDEQIMVKVTGLTSFIDSKTYYAVSSASSTNGTSTSYYFTNGVNYMFRGATTVAGANVEVQYLDKSLAIGEKWITKVNDAGAINGIAARIEGSIVERDITKTIGENTFTDVIHTTVNLQYDNGQSDGFVTAVTYDFYLAKSIGLIELDYSVSGVLTSKETIASYNVK